MEREMTKYSRLHNKVKQAKMMHLDIATLLRIDGYKTNCPSHCLRKPVFSRTLLRIISLVLNSLITSRCHCTLWGTLKTRGVPTITFLLLICHNIHIPILNLLTLRHHRSQSLKTSNSRAGIQWPRNLFLRTLRSSLLARHAGP
jgi:hypothetical protein